MKSALGGVLSGAAVTGFSTPNPIPVLTPASLHLANPWHGVKASAISSVPVRQYPIKLGIGVICGGARLAHHRRIHTPTRRILSIQQVSWFM